MAPTKLEPTKFIKKYFNAMTNIIVPYFNEDKIFEFYKNNNGNLRYPKEKVCKYFAVHLRNDINYRVERLRDVYSEVAFFAEHKIKVKKVANFQSFLDFFPLHLNQLTKFLFPVINATEIIKYYLINNGCSDFKSIVMQAQIALREEREKTKETLKNIYTEAAAMAPSFVFNKTIEANIESENESDNESKYDTDNDIECESSMDIEIQDEAIIEPFINIRKLENWIDNQCRFSEKEIYNRDNWESVFDWFYNDTLTELSYSEFNEYMKDFEKDYLVWSEHVNKVNSKYECARQNLAGAFEENLYLFKNNLFYNNIMIQDNIFNIYYKKSLSEPNVSIFSFVLNPIETQTIKILNFAVLLFNYYNLKQCKGEFVIYLKTNIEDKKFIFCCDFDSKDFGMKCLSAVNESFILLELNIYIKIHKVILEQPRDIIKKLYGDTISKKVYNSELLY